jgi:L-threonylcarbamoyladenylate synthase
MALFALPSDAADAIPRAVRVLRAGGLVGLPTETVYGLGADATSAVAVAKIFAAKGRPQFNPLIAHLADMASLRREGVLDARAEALAEAFWPGPLTLVVPRGSTPSVCDLACAGLPTIALRRPRHPVMEAVIRDLDRPIAAPSANPSGRLSPTRAHDVVTDLGDKADIILDAGPAPHGVESTILSVLPGEPIRLLRPGALSVEDLEAVAGPIAARPASGGPGDAALLSPGQLASHYAPRARLRLDAQSPRGDEGFLGFGPVAHPGGLNLSPAGDLREAAANLFAMLRALDAAGTAVIAVAPIPSGGLGAAIRDRLARAAAPRD